MDVPQPLPKYAYCCGFAAAMRREGVRLPSIPIILYRE